MNARFLAAPAIGGGTPMVGCALNISITNANSVEELENIGIEAGGSMNWSYFGIGCPIGGVEFISGIREDGSNWVGINFSVMDLGKLVAQIASLGMLIPVEMHGEASCTYLEDIPEWLEGGVIRLVKFIAKEALLNMPLESRMLFTKQMGISIEDFINEQKNW